jgi:transcriptional regulator with XRE-family HTH domain
LKIHKEDSKQLVRLLWSLSGSSRQSFAAAVEIDPSTLWRYEKGKIVPDRTLLRQMAAVAGVSMGLVDLHLLPALTTARLTRTATLGRGPEFLEGGVLEQTESGVATANDNPLHLGNAELERSLREVCQTSLPVLFSELDEAIGSNDELAEICGGLETCTIEELRFLAEACREFQSAAVVAWLCERSEETASASGSDALELADLALRVTEVMPATAATRQRVRGECLVYRANALRVTNALSEAALVFAEAKRLLQSCASDFQPHWRLLDLEASLRRDQRNFGSALHLLDMALDAAPAENKARVLVKRAVVHEHSGSPLLAVQALIEAEPHMDRSCDPRLPLVHRFNLAHNLCCLNRAAEAEALLPEIRERAATRKLDCVRVTWLEGKVAAGLGRVAEARAAFEQVQAEFCRLKMPCDGALVSLDLAVLHLQHGRTAEVRALAEEMIWIFESQGIHREALAALDLFCQAARQEAATAELARRVAGYLQTSRHDPERRFEP